MPFKSKAQRRKFAQLLVQGKISDETFEEWNRETGGQKLPERVVHRTARKKKAIDGFYAYYRTWSVDPSGSTVTHHIEQSLYPGVQSLLYGHHLRVGTRIDNEQPRTPPL